MSLIKDALNEQIQNDNRTQFTETSATILEYDRTSELCKIKYLNPNGEGYIYRGGVEINHSSGGLSSGSFYAGQQCSISFINNNVYNPVINGVYQSYYQERSCTDQGAYIADDNVWKVGSPEHIIAMMLDWLDDGNIDLSKYENSNGRYTDTDADRTALDIVTTLDKYEDSEVGLTNLKNKSTIKLRDNGDIDIFSSANTGLRICNDTGNIKFYGNDIEFTKATGESEKTDHSISTQLKVAQIMKICLAYDIIKEVDSYVSMMEEDFSSIGQNEDESVDSSQFQDLSARIESYKTLKEEFYQLDVDDDEKIDEYIKIFQQFNDEFLDAVGEVGVTMNSNITPMSSEDRSSLIALAKTFIGHTYIWGAEGEMSDSKGLCFDCSGFVTYLMKELGLMPQNANRLTVATIPVSGYFNEISWNSIQAGDILCNSSLSHVVIYEGNNRIIHASNSAPYPKGGVKEDNLYFTGRAFRIKGYGVE